MDEAKDSITGEDSLRQDYLENPISTGNKSQSHSLCSHPIWHSSEVVKKYLTFYQRLHNLDFCCVLHDTSFCWGNLKYRECKNWGASA